MKKLLLLVTAALLLSGCELVTGSDKKSSSDTTTPSVHGKVTITYTGGTSFPTDARLGVYLIKTGSKASSTPNFTLAVTAAGTYQYSVTGLADGSYTIVAYLEQLNGSGVYTGNNYGSQSPVNQTITVTGGAASVDPFTITYDGSGAQGN